MSLFRSEISKHLTQPNPEVSRLSARTYPGMAHFAGTGPDNANCGKCRNFGAGRSKNRPCLKFIKMMNGVTGALIPPSAAACKYYDAKQEPLL